MSYLAAKLQAVKVGGLKKILPLCRPRGTRVGLGLRGRIFVKLPTLRPCNFAATLERFAVELQWNYSDMTVI